VNICLVTGEYPPENGWGGIATYTYYMAKALCKFGHRVFVIANMEKGAQPYAIQKGIVVLRVKPSNIHYYMDRLNLRLVGLPSIVRVWENQIAVSRALRHLEGTEGIDVVEYADSYAPGFWHRRFCRTPYVVKLHIPSFVYEDFYGRSTLRILLTQMERLFITRADAVTSPSKYLASRVSQRAHLERLRTSIVPNPIDVEEFAPSRLGVDDPITVLYAGWLSRIKGVDVLANAIPFVASRFPQCRFLIAGQDSRAYQDVGCRHENLEAFLRSRQVSDRVRFMGFVPRGEMVSLYQRAQVCVIPSRYDNFPYTCVEAFACGKAVVGTDVGGIPELISDHETGILVQKDDPIALADGINEMLEDNAIRGVFGMAARSKVESNYSLEKIAKQTLEVYDAVV
jgi:glycogen(starch) synthase